MKISPSLLVDAVGCKPGLAEVFAPHIAETCERFDITTPGRLAMFLAQVSHESGSFKYVREIWGPTAAQLRYEGRADLGNTQPGDGKRYAGKGLIQTTGRANHRELRPGLLLAGYSDVPDFEADPERLTEPRWAAASAGFFWASRNLNALADAGQFDAITKRVNGGMNGAADRRLRWSKALSAINLHAKADNRPANDTEVQVVADTPAETLESDSTPQYMPAGEILPETPTMAPFVAAALQAILPAVPKLIDTFGSGSEVSKRNEKAAELVVSVAKDALGAVNEQEVAERLKNDPAAPAAVRAAVEAKWFAITQEVGGGVASARAADAAYQHPDSKGFWHSPVFWITMALLPLVYIALYAVLFKTGFSNDIKAMVLGAIFGGLLTGGIQSYFYGTSASSAKKTDMIGGR